MAKRTRRQRNSDPGPVASNPDGGDEGGDKLSKECWERWRQGRAHLRDWRSDTKENYDFLASRQWTEEDLATLQDQQRVPITFNRTMAIVNGVSGYEINNRQEVTFLPREPEESGEADVDTKAAKFFRQEGDAEDEESEQFRRCLSSGYGWIEHRMDYDENPDGMMKVEAVDEMEMVYDPSAARPNLVDRKWDIRGKWWDKDVAKEKWPDADFDSGTPTSYDEGDLDGQKPVDRLEAAFYKPPGVGETAQQRKNKVFILEYTWHELEPFYTVVNPTSGKTEDVEPKIHKALQDKLAERGMMAARSVKRTRRRFKRAFIHGRDTLTPEAEWEAPCPEQFHYQCITGYRDRNKNTFFGLVTLMKDPQRWANKWLSQFLHLLNTNVKTGLWYEKGAFERPGAVEAKIAKPGFVQQVEAGYLAKIKKEEPASIPQDAFNLMTYAINSIRDVTGANLEIMGQQQNDQPGVVENARKSSAMAVLAPLFAAQRQYRKIAGRLTLYFIRTYLSDGRLIRIVGQGNAKYVPLTKRPDAAKYDIIVDESPTSPNQKEAVFATLASLLPVLLKANIPIPSSVLEYAPGLPMKLIEDWIKEIEAKKKQPPQPDPKTQLAQQKLQQEATESANQDALDKQRLQFDQMKEQVAQLMQDRDLRMREKELALKERQLASTERQHLGTLAADALNQHHDRLSDHVMADADRTHDRKMLSLKPKPKPNGGANAK